MAKSTEHSLFSATDFERLFEAAPDAILLVNRHGEIERLNNQAQAVFGYKPDELLGEPVEILIPQRFRNGHVVHRQRFAEDPKTRPMGSSPRLYARHKDGSEFPVDVNLSPIRVRGRTITAAAVRDVSDSHRIARDLQAANSRLRKEKRFSDSLITTQQGIVLVIDPAGRISLVNPYFEELTGYRAEQIIGLDWFDTFIPDNQRSAIRELFREVMREGINRGFANAILTKAGRERLIQWQSKTLEDHDGNITGLLSTGYDVTDREAASRALAEAKSEADRANSIKTRFLAAASHDLRQPLQALGIYLSVLTRELSTDRTRDVAGKMRQTLDTMSELLDALLDISMLDSGTIVPDRADFPLQHILDQVAADNVPYAESKGLAVRIEPTQLTVNSDPTLLQRIIENFVSNAIRYTEAGEVRVVSQTVGRFARIDVVDTGIGIPRDAIDTIFEEYFQLGNPVRNRSKGLGLGLSIVKHLAQLLDHDVSVQSTHGEGSTFSVTVPAVRSLPKTEPLREPSGVPPPRSQGVSVLVIDDDPSVVDATRILLEVEGFDVQAATDGDEALALIDAGLRPHVVVSDYRLPGFSGVDAVRRIRSLTADDVPAIVVTGDTSGQEIVNAELRRCRVLRKPVDADILISLIRELRL